jgi:hypothetical protein
MASLTQLNHRKQSSSRLARELHLGMAASDARGPQFGEGPAIHFRLSRVRSLPGPTATGLYFTVLLCMLYSLHDGSARCFREASDWPLRRAAHSIGRRCSSSLLLFLPWFSLPFSCSPLVFSFSAIRPATFCTCNEAGHPVCLYLPIERLMPLRGPVHKIQMDRIRNQTEGSPYFE